MYQLSQIESSDMAEKERLLSASIIKSLPGIFYFFDENGKFLQWNKNFETISGYTAKEISGMTPDQFFKNDQQEYIKSRIAKVFSEGSSDAEADFLSKEGTTTPFYFTGIRLEFEGKPCLLGVGIDITEKIKAKKELEQSYKTLRQLTSHIQQVREDERKHIAREIHDELGQQITVIKMDVSWIRKKTDPSNIAVLNKIEELMAVVDETVKSIRKISSRLRPSLLDDLGLIAAIEWYLNDFQQRTTIEFVFHLPKYEIELSDSTATSLFRILQESLTNVVRHADAKKVVVNLLENKDGIVLSVKDDGKGYDEENISGKQTLGILGMKERAAMIGGKYTISGAPDKGTIVSIEVPSRYYLSKQNELI